MPASLATGHQDSAIRSFGHRSATGQATDRYGRQQGVAVVQHAWYQELSARVTSNGDSHASLDARRSHKLPSGQERQFQCWAGLCNLVFGRGTTSRVPAAYHGPECPESPQPVHISGKMTLRHRGPIGHHDETAIIRRASLLGPAKSPVAPVPAPLQQPPCSTSVFRLSVER